MPFVESVLDYGSVAFIGMDKNSGKTEAMNYFLQRAFSLNTKRIAVTSIGIDGERKDKVTGTEKPEITLPHGAMLLTCESYYHDRRLVSEIIDISDDSTALGRLVTARVLSQGEIMLAGPANTFMLKSHISRLKSLGAELVVVDGALSRLSIASPTVTDALILSTGAVVSHRLEQIVEKSAYQVELIRLAKSDSRFCDEMNSLGRGIYNITEQGVIDSGVDSVFTLSKNADKLFERGTKLFFSGAVNDSLFEFLSLQLFTSDIEVVVRDFTKVFVSKRVLGGFRARGGRLSVLNRSKLLAVCVNPISPLGYRVSSERLCDMLSQKIEQNVYDVRNVM